MLADKRLRYFERAKNADGCRTTAELWEKLPCTDGESYFNAARYRAVAASLYQTDPNKDAARLADEQGDRAMAWLQKAVAAGYNDLAALSNDKDLDALRDRASFKKLLADVEAMRKAGK
jgi:hypothetical protein